jgi:hypothetical protein
MKQYCGWLGKVETNIGTPRSGMKNTDFRTPLCKIHDQNHESMLLKNWGHREWPKMLEAVLILQGEGWCDGVP